VVGRAEQEARITFEKDEHIKTVEAEILQLKADIYLKVGKVGKRIIQILNPPIFFRMFNCTI
jgi:hypothetical protein